MKITTIGYEGLSPETFWVMLRNHSIQVLVDVRHLPLSRKAGFSKSNLSSASQSYGIRYVHMRGLGCPNPIRNDYREDKNWQRYTRRFKEHLTTTTAQTALQELTWLVEQQRCCLMCFEADYRFCHRLYVAEHLSARFADGASVLHLTAKNYQDVVGVPLPA